MELKFDSTSKLMLVVFILLTSYLFIISIISLPFGINPGDNIFNFSSSKESMLNIIALIISVGIGFVVSLIIKTSEPRNNTENTKHTDNKNIEFKNAESYKPISKEHELSILKKALSKDEKLVLEEIEKSVEITQDSLRYRLNFSKAKVSAIITNLDRMGLVQRERQGKTYKVFLQRSK